MTSLIPLIALIPFVAEIPSPDGNGSLSHAHRHHPQAEHHGSRHPLSPMTTSVRVMIVNATCAPALSLSCSGTNLPPAYPIFAQGDWIADPPATNPVADYVARTTGGEFLREGKITFKPVSKQFLLLTGTLERGADPSHLPGMGVDPLAVGTQEMRPGQARGDANLQFHVIPCEGVVKDPCHYRIVNAIPGMTLIVRKPPEGMQPARELAYLPPGNSVLLTDQPAVASYDVEVGESVFKLEILQEGAVANCLIPFYLRDGKPTYATIFESP